MHEARQGLLFARLRGLREARFEYICFLDDDNVPGPNFVENGIRAFGNQSVGMLTSRVFPKYARIPPAAMLRREHLLAINRSLGAVPIEWKATFSCAPTIGAGMWLRRSLAALQAIPIEYPSALLTDRIGKQMLSGGDIEFGILMGLAGFIPPLRAHLRSHSFDTREPTHHRVLFTFNYRYSSQCFNC